MVSGPVTDQGNWPLSYSFFGEPLTGVVCLSLEPFPQAARVFGPSLGIQHYHVVPVVPALSLPITAGPGHVRRATL